MSLKYVSNVTKSMLYIPKKGDKDTEYLLDVGDFKDLINKKIHKFSKKITKLIKGKDNPCDLLMPYFVKLSKKKGFNGKMQNNKISLEDYFKNFSHLIKQGNSKLRVSLTIGKFIETIDCKDIKHRFNGPRDIKKDKAAMYSILRSFCNSRNKKFNKYIDEKINELLE